MRFTDFITPTQKGLYKKIRSMFPNNISKKNGYILVKGDAPILLVAHMDTVHKEPVREICRTADGNIWMSPQGIGGDDRCGVYALCSVYAQAEVKPWLLFTCDEEVGCLGAIQFCDDYTGGILPLELGELKAVVEIDRRGKNDAVYYDCDNAEFEAYVTSKGFHTEWGSYSDISYIAPELGVAAVNLSSGYYNAHTQHEYINRKELEEVIRKVASMVKDATKEDFPRYEYVECYKSYNSWRKWDYKEGTFSKKYYREDSSSKKYHKEEDTDSKRYSEDGLLYFEKDDDDDAFYYNYKWDVLKDVPRKIREEYAALLDYYDAEELEYCYNEGGDIAILDLFKREFESWNDCYDAFA